MNWIKPRKLQQIKCYTSLLIRRTYALQKQLPVLTLFTKDPCPLCDEAKEVLDPFKDRFILQEVDITLPENKVWFERYKYDIPVFHLNGQYLMMHRVHMDLLEKKLASIEQRKHHN
nr:PREDICTED: glutaredoxin-like protein C5orf63 homolog [Lepisosteus oculatus]XP_015222941.1 PREDICTED: glutaredoxin-like protein C5orf63 homolog [Lepisosteus oculatus]